MTQFADTLSSVLSAMGFQNRGGVASAVPIYGQGDLEALYRTSGLARKIHNIPPADMTREWRSWKTDKDKIEALEAEERRLQIPIKVRRALTLARLHGGAALVLGLPGNPNQECKPEAIKKEGLGFVHVVNRHQLQISELETDPYNPRFGQPKDFRMSGPSGETTLHPSRVIPFIANPIPEGAMGGGIQNYWGDPLIMTLKTSLDHSEKAQQAVADLLDEAKIDIIKIPNLMGMVGNADYEAKLLKRLTLAVGFKSSAGALLISGGSGPSDPAEEWDQRQVDFAGLPDVAMMLLSVLAGVADVPATRLLGKSPDGMNATGDNDLRNYYDMLASEQSGEFSTSLDPLDEYLIRSALGSRPDEVYYEWNALWQLAPESAATVHKTKAETIKIYSDIAALPSRAIEEGVQNMLIEDGLLPGLEGVLEKMSEEERFPSLTAPDPADLTIDPTADPSLEVGGEKPVGKLPATRLRAANDLRTIRDWQRQAIVSDSMATILADASPRTLYVSRPVLNAADIVAHFKGQGIETTPPEDMHVTLAFSRAPVDWMAIASDWSREPNGEFIVSAGGPRMMERFGDDQSALVLLFNANELTWRHQEILRAGATWDWPEFQPHITISYAVPPDFDLSEVEPWKGEIRLGAEDFQEVKEDWKEGISET